MRTSEGIDQLIGALAKARGAFPEIACTELVSTNTYKYSYADLSDILAAVTPGLSAAELALLGGVENDAQGSVVVTVRLAHVSGQWAESQLSIGTWAKMQELGAALTYARRYLTCVILGIQPGGEDADGQTPASSPRPRNQETQAFFQVDPERTPGQKNAEARQREQLLGAITASLKEAGLEKGAMQQQLFDAFCTAGWSKIKAMPLAGLQAGYATLQLALRTRDAPPDVDMPDRGDAPRAIEEIRSPALQDAPGDAISQRDGLWYSSPPEDATTGPPGPSVATDEQIAGLEFLTNKLGAQAVKALDDLHAVIKTYPNGLPIHSYEAIKANLEARAKEAQQSSKQGALV